MKLLIPAIALLAVSFGAARAEAQSCSTFVLIQSYDAAGSLAEVKYGRGSQKKYFPKPEGANTDTTKIPKKCSKRDMRLTSVKVKASGGRMSVTQFRENFSGKMRNDLDDSNWVATNLQKLIDDKTQVVAILRPARKKGDPGEMTTIYMPINDEGRAEIARIEAQAEDVE